MHDTRVVLKDGTVYSNPIWEYRPLLGYLTLVGYDQRFFFRDMESCITENQRCEANTIKDVDELERARKDGWNGT